jgi:hypothetical protein
MQYRVKFYYKYDEPWETFDGVPNLPMYATVDSCDYDAVKQKLEEIIGEPVTIESITEYAV